MFVQTQTQTQAQTQAQTWAPTPVQAQPQALQADATGATAVAPAPAAAASAPGPGPSTDATVRVSAQALRTSAGIAGFGHAALDRSPFQASVVQTPAWRDSGGTGLAALTRYDASVSDAYNAEGYWAGFTVRGFAIDNRYNFLRDGLPINAETSLPLDNKSAIEVLRGTSGIQAGTSAPGGLVNMIVKRPEGTLRSAGIDWQQNGSVGAWADISQRFGAGDAFGLRLNVAGQRLDPPTRDARGQRNLFALAGDWRVSPDTLLEAEIESSRQSQPSVPGFSLLGSKLPSATDVDPRINLNNQPWSLPVVLEGTTGSLRWQQRLSADWKLQAHALQQRLHSDDRLAYSFGCSKEGNYDRYCSDGSFDYYAYRSDSERRTSTAMDLQLQGRVTGGGVDHTLVFGALATRFRLHTQAQTDDSVIVGTGTVDGLSVIPTLPADLGRVPNTNRTERSTELYARDHAQLTPALGLWAGLRQTWLERASLQTDGSQATDYRQAIASPWLAITQALAGDRLVYASWGQGSESAVAPNRPGYTNPGQPLPAIKSRQMEIGIKQAGSEAGWSLAAFDIRRPLFDDVSQGCDSSPDPCITTRLDGQVRNRGIEANLHWARGPLSTQIGAMWLQARTSGNSDPALNGMRPTNVPDRTLKASAGYALARLPGLTLHAAMVFEGDRMVLPDNSIQIPGWTRWDLGAEYTTQADGTTLTWRLGVDNAANRRAWRESPYEYQHVYLFPLALRTWRASIQASL